MKKRLSFIFMIVGILFLFSLSFAQENGNMAPDFSAKDTNGNTHSLSKYRGKVILLKFWASWCGPCRRSMPKAKRLQQKFGSQGFMVFAVGLSRNPSRDQSYLSSNGYNFPVQVYPGGFNTGSYRVRGIPREFLIDRNGKLLWSGHPARLDESLIKNALRSEGNSDNSNTNNNVNTTVSDSIGALAPNYTGTDINGKKHSLYKYRGKVILLKFWASWCGPCRRSMPKTTKLQKKYGSRGFMVFSVGLARNRERDISFLRNNGYNFPVMIVGRGRNFGYRYRGIPFEVLIGKDGRIIWKGHPARFNQRLLEQALRGNSVNPNSVDSNNSNTEQNNNNSTNNVDDKD